MGLRWIGVTAVVAGLLLGCMKRPPGPEEAPEDVCVVYESGCSCPVAVTLSESRHLAEQDARKDCDRPACPREAHLALKQQGKCVLVVVQP